jgi:glutamyl-tRNA reductase
MRPRNHWLNPRPARPIIPDMLAIGLNHKSAPIALREQLAFSNEQMPFALRELVGLDAVNEAVILSTCNRVELYCAGSAEQAVLEWLAKYRGVSPEELAPHLYCHRAQDAVRHVMQVASGLDSMMLGEAQIFGQLKQAYTIAQEAGTVGDVFGRLFPTVFTVTKQVRTDTDVGASPVSIAYAAVHHAKRIFSSFEKHPVLLIGAGDTIEMVAMHLYNQGARRIIVANRSLERAESIAKKYHGHWIRIGDVPAYLKEVDIVVTATASQLPILGKGTLESALKVRKHRPIFIVDLAIPRDVEAEAAELEDIYLYNIDDLISFVDQNLKCRESAAVKAQEIITMAAAHFMREWRGQDALVTVRDYRYKIEKMRDEALEEAKLQIQRGQCPQQALTLLSRTLTNKIMHSPTIHLRQAAFDDRPELLAFARLLFDL